MTEWTTKNLDALPWGTALRYLTGSSDETAMRSADGWRVFIGYQPYLLTSTELAERVTEGVVVSVPVDALLSPRPVSVGLGRIDPTSEAALMVVRAAIAHATGEGS